MSPNRFAANSTFKKLIARQVATRPVEAGDKAKLNRVFGRR